MHNPDVLQQHLMCAALEHPLLLDQDVPYFGPRMPQAVWSLMEASLVSRRPPGPGATAPGTAGPLSLAGWQLGPGTAAASGGAGPGSWLSVPLVYSGPRDNPASAICLRSIDPERYVIWDEVSRMPLEEIEANMAFYEVGEDGGWYQQL